MTPVRTPNRWSCLAASFATCLDLSFDQLVERLGHDGSRIIRPHLSDPERRRGFHPQEMIDVAEKLGRIVTPFEARPCLRVQGDDAAYPIDMATGHETRICEYLARGQGVLTGLNLRKRPHAVVWDGRVIYDPAIGETYRLNLFSIDTFWRIMNIASLK